MIGPAPDPSRLKPPPEALPCQLTQVRDLTIYGGPGSTPRITKTENGRRYGAVEIRCDSRRFGNPVRLAKAAIASHDERIIGWFRLD